VRAGLLDPHFRELREYLDHPRASRGHGRRPCSQHSFEFAGEALFAALRRVLWQGGALAHDMPTKHQLLVWG
jgi:hypothetical protein